MKRLFIVISIVFATSTVWAWGDNLNVEISPFGGVATQAVMLMPWAGEQAFFSAFQLAINLPWASRPLII